MDEFRLDPTPPRKMPTLNIVRLKAGEEMFCRCLSQKPFGYYSHWAGKFSVLCRKDAAKCEGCRKQMPVKWKGLLHVINQSNGRAMFVEITNTVGLALADQLPMNEDLRGKRLRLCRSRGGDNGRLKAEVMHEARPALDLPAELDPWPTLARIFDLERPFDTQPETL